MEITKPSNVRVSSTRSQSSPDLTTLLLACGVGIAPFFLGLSLAQVPLRPGFNLRVLAISALSLGDLGWIQVLNFVFTGLLGLACALGIRRALVGRRMIRFLAPVLIGFFGLGTLLAGVFHPDPALGFPPGAPAGMPATMSAHGTVHQLSFVLGFLAVIVCCFVFSRHFWTAGRRNWAVYCAASGVATPIVIVAGIATPAWVGVLFVAAGLVGQGWISAISARLLLDERTPGPVGGRGCVR